MTEPTPSSAGKDAGQSAESDTGLCGKCKAPIKRVDLTGTPFFTHKPGRDCITYWHADSNRNLSHQAVPA